MTTRGVIMLAGGAIAGFLVCQHFTKKAGSSESFTGRRRGRPTTQKAGGYGFCRCSTKPTIWTKLGFQDVSCRNFDNTPQPCDKHCSALGLVNIDAS